MTKLERLKEERKLVQRQVDLFEKKYKNFDTSWHKTLKRVNKEIAKLEKKKKPKSKGGPLKASPRIIGEPGPETIVGKVVPDKLVKENNDG